MEDNQELMKNLQETISALAKKWGVGTQTPFGSIVVCGASSYTFQATWEHHDSWGMTISVYSYGNRYWAKKTRDIYKASTDDLFYLAQQLAAMTQYFASEDFQAKVKGSIALLKRINNALKG